MPPRSLYAALSPLWRRRGGGLWSVEGTRRRGAGGGTPPVAFSTPPQEVVQLPLGHHVPNQRHLDDDGAALVYEALDEELGYKEQRSGHEPREHRDRLHHTFVVYEVVAVLVVFGSREMVEGQQDGEYSYRKQHADVFDSP